MVSCERCQATSTPCTYTLSSGTGRGKKRVRRQPFSDSAVGCFPVEAEQSDDGSLTRQGGAGVDKEHSQRLAARRAESSKYHTMVPLPPEHGDSSATSIVDSAPWPVSGTRFSGILAFADDGDFLDMGESIDLSEGKFNTTRKQVSLGYCYFTKLNVVSPGSHVVDMLISENDSRLWDASPLQSREYLSGLSDTARTHLGEKPKENGEGSGLSTDRLLRVSP